MYFPKTLNDIRLRLNRALNHLTPEQAKRFDEGHYLSVRMQRSQHRGEIVMHEPADTDDVRQLLKDAVDTIDPYFLERARAGDHLVIRLAPGSLPKVACYPPAQREFLPKEWKAAERTEA